MHAALSTHTETPPPRSTFLLSAEENADQNGLRRYRQLTGKRRVSFAADTATAFLYENLYILKR
ncbi:hypothetical protein ALCH109712_14075 [Alkalicoccus chagannorensis]